MEVTIIHPDFVKNFPNNYGEHSKNVQIKIFSSICKVWMISQRIKTCPEMRFQEAFCKNFYIFETRGYKKTVDLKNELTYYIDNNGTYPSFDNIIIEIRRNKNGSNQIWYIVPKVVYIDPYKLGIEEAKKLKKKFEEKLVEEYNSDIVQALRQISDAEIKNLSSIIDKDNVTKIITDLYCLLDKCFINHKIEMHESSISDDIRFSIKFNCDILRIREIQFVCLKYPKLIKSVLIDVENMKVFFAINKHIDNKHKNRKQTQKKRKRDNDDDEELHDDNNRKTKRRR
jgi:hypothetical protein